MRYSSVNHLPRSRSRQRSPQNGKERFSWRGREERPQTGQRKEVATPRIYPRKAGLARAGRYPAGAGQLAGTSGVTAAASSRGVTAPRNSARIRPSGSIT